MFQTEKHLRQWLMKHIPGHWQPVELSQGVGVPDLNYCVDGREGWAELKVIRIQVPQDASTRVTVNIRPAQYAWMTQRTRAGGRACFVIGVSNVILIVRDLYCIKRMMYHNIPWNELVSMAGGVFPADQEHKHIIQELL